MRGCLAILVMGLAFLVVLAWFVLPPIAGVAVSAGLIASGLSGHGTSVIVTASPPLELLAMRADAVEIRSTDVSWRGLDAATLAVRLDRVDLGARTAASVDGRLGDVSVPVSGGTIHVEVVALAGPGSSVTATLTVDAATATALAAAAVERAAGARPSSVALVAPDRVVVTVGALQVQGRLIIDGGALVLVIEPIGRVVVAEPASGLPFVVSSVAVDTGGPVRLVGTLDPRALGLGG
jgi:hypothetical protein